MEGKSMDAADKMTASVETFPELPMLRSIPESWAVANDGVVSGKSGGEVRPHTARGRPKDPNWKAKRLRSSRLSSLQARIRKREYVIKLEDKVKALQNEAAMLTSTHLIFKHEIRNLEMENKNLRERLMICAHEGMIQKAQLQAITSEASRLRNLAFQQTLMRRAYGEPVVRRSSLQDVNNGAAVFSWNYPRDQINPESNDQEVGDHDHDGADENETGSDNDEEVDG